MFKPLKRDGKILGYGLERKGRYYFFGTRWLAREQLAEIWPQWKFHSLKQVHGREVVMVSDQTPEADAHYTAQAGHALVVQSADCLPILLSSERTICAIHAGWRGIAQNIVAAVANKLPDFKPDFAALGPHIMRPSFEVGQDVAETLLRAGPAEAGGFTAPHASPDKAYFDLKALARAQLTDSFGSALEIAECCEDTKTNLLFHSFRRDGRGAGRQLSFVVIGKMG